MSRAAWLGVGVGLGVVGVGAWLARRAQAATLDEGAGDAEDVDDPDAAGGGVGGGVPIVGAAAAVVARLGAAARSQGGSYDPAQGPASSSTPPSSPRPNSPPPTGWVWPVPRFFDGRAPRVSSGWGSKRDGGKRRHRGVDVMYRRRNRRELVEQFPPGTANGSPLHFMDDLTPVLAARAGVVRWVKKTRRGYEVVIRHDGWTTYYQHLERPIVRVGQRVATGEAIGTVGGSPLDSDKLKHLHFELWRGESSAGAVDPKPHMARWAVLAAPAETARDARNLRRGDQFADPFRKYATPDRPGRHPDRAHERTL